MRLPGSSQLVLKTAIAGLAFAGVVLALATIFPALAAPSSPNVVSPASSAEWRKMDFCVSQPGVIPGMLAPLQLNEGAQSLSSAPSLTQAGIHGRVTASGSPVSSITLVLRVYDNASETSVLTATAGINGDYLFTDVPALPSGKTYYVRYGLNTTDSNYVAIWFGPDITSYAAGQSIAGGDFDIANIPLQSPLPGATTSFPVTFTWTKRDVPTDSYQWRLIDTKFADLWHNDSLGYVDQLTLQYPPEGAVYDQPYWWYMIVQASSDSFGIAYYMRQVTLTPWTTRAIALQPGLNLVAFPLTPADPEPAAVFAAVQGQNDLTYTYDACDTSDPWKKYDPAAPSFANDLAQVDVLHGYWLHTSGAVTLNLAGRLPWPVSIPLCAGWNLIGYPSAAPVPLPDALASIAGKYDAVFAYDSTDPIDPWKQYDPAAPPGANDLLALEPGKGYWIRATASTVLKVP